LFSRSKGLVDQSFFQWLIGWWAGWWWGVDHLQDLDEAERGSEHGAGR
jgi:hypothetical protein